MTALPPDVTALLPSRGASDSENSVAKVNLRKYFRMLRLSLPEHARAASADRVREVLLRKLGDCAPKGVVASYASLPGELDTGRLNRALLAAGYPLALPRCEGDHLVLHHLISLDALRAGKFGVPEPPSGSPVVRAPRWLIVPGLAFDEAGGRLGFGGGYYDRLLAELRVRQDSPVVLGIAFQEQLLPQGARLPMEPHDMRVDWIATPLGIRRAALP